MKCDEIRTCLCCGSDELFIALDLGFQPPANDFSSRVPFVLEKYPLVLKTCKKCWHSQLSHCIDRNVVFENYVYESGTSQTLNKYFEWFANQLRKKIPATSYILDIAANDGSLVDQLVKCGFNAVGIDPAANIVDKAVKNGSNVLCGFWPQDKDIIKNKQDVIVCMNVLAHVGNPKEFLIGCRDKLAKDGMILIQPSQVRMFGNMEFDTCYHEHISFFNTKSISALCESIGLKLVDSILVRIHGDSPIYVLKHSDGSPDQEWLDALKEGDFYIDERLDLYEDEINLFNMDTYLSFRKRSVELVAKLKKVVNDFRLRGYDIVFVGAAAKAMTVINAAEIFPDFFLDESPLKIGLYPPGLKIKVCSFSDVNLTVRPALIVITAWNFKEEIQRKLLSHGLHDDSMIYTYFPTESLAGVCK